MDSITNGLSRAGNYLTTIGISDFVDIIIVAYLIYRAIWFVRKTNFMNLAKGVILILVALWASEFFRLTMINFILRKAVELGLIALLILFQPELRRLLERMGSTLNAGRGSSGTMMSRAISQTVEACTDMSASKTGALIAFERNVTLSAVIGTGSVINADTNAELLKNLFFNKAPLHDGAVIIRDGRIEAAGCVLPLTQSLNLSKELGMRHRAGLGLSEQSDAVVVIVSEETGAISVAVDGSLKRHLTGKELGKVLSEELIHEESKVERPDFINTLKNFLKGKDNADQNENEKTV